MGTRILKMIIGTVAAAAVGATPAAASHDGSAGGSRDFAAGSAKNVLADVTGLPVELHVAAHAFDDEVPMPLFGSSDVTGHVVGSGMFPQGEFMTAGHVTCLKVVGNQASIKYRFDRTSGPGAPPAGWGVQVFIEDNGPPGGGTRDGNATDPPLPPVLFDPQADQCELPRPPYNPVDSGNYVVHDGDAAP